MKKLIIFFIALALQFGHITQVNAETRMKTTVEVEEVRNDDGSITQLRKTTTSTYKDDKKVYEETTMEEVKIYPLLSLMP